MADSALYSIRLTMNDGSESSFGRFAGTAVLVVNVASKCGFTPQYEGLEALYQRYRERGFEILGVPCNQFAHQEPGDDAEIASFCSLTYGVDFPLTAKADVRGKDRHPLYGELTKFKNGILPGLVKWNFEKFLVDPQGQIVARFPPTTDPLAPEVTAAVERVLPQP